MLKYICQNCKKTYNPIDFAYKCSCGGLFYTEFNYTRPDFNKTDNRNEGIWKYIDSMPFENNDSAELITMGEGNTPLIRLNPINKFLLAKCDFFMPTLSFKDRGAAVLIAHAHELGVKQLVCDSSGNAGTSISAYAARAGIKCDVFVPESTSEKKVQQIIAHNAIIHKVPGNREMVAAAAIRSVEVTGAFYASHVYNPVFYEGTKTYFFEVYEKLGNLPYGFIIPVGNGTLLLGADRAFNQLMEWGLIQEKPKIFAVQAENCAPIYHSYKTGEEAIVENKGTKAEGIAIAAPPRGPNIIEIIKETEGDIITVNDEETLKARQEMASFGLYAEITSAVNYAAYKKISETDPDIKKNLIVMPLCGAGIKS